MRVYIPLPGPFRFKRVLNFLFPDLEKIKILSPKVSLHNSTFCRGFKILNFLCFLNFTWADFVNSSKRRWNFKNSGDNLWHNIKNFQYRKLLSKYPPKEHILNEIWIVLDWMEDPYINVYFAYTSNLGAQVEIGC